MSIRQIICYSYFSISIVLPIRFTLKAINNLSYKILLPFRKTAAKLHLLQQEQMGGSHWSINAVTGWQNIPKTYTFITSGEVLIKRHDRVYSTYAGVCLMYLAPPPLPIMIIIIIPCAPAPTAAGGNPFH